MFPLCATVDLALMLHLGVAAISIANQADIDGDYPTRMKAMFEI